MVGQQTGQPFVVFLSIKLQTSVYAFFPQTAAIPGYTIGLLLFPSLVLKWLWFVTTQTAEITCISLVVARNADTSTNKTRIVWMVTEHIFWLVAGVSFLLQWYVANLVISLQLLTDLQRTPMA